MGPGFHCQTHWGLPGKAPGAGLSSERQRRCRHHLLPPVWPQRAAGEGQEQYLPAGGRLPGLPAEEPALAPGGWGLRSCQPPIVSGTLQFQQLLPRQWARRIYSWTEPESSLTASDLKKTENSLDQEEARPWPWHLHPFALGNFYFWVLPSPWNSWLFFSKRTSANSLAAVRPASVFGNLHFRGGSLKPHFVLFSDSPQPSPRQLLCLLNTFSSWPCRRTCTARRQGQNPCASFLLIRRNQFSSQSPESLLWWNPLINQKKGVREAETSTSNPYWRSQVPLFRRPLLLSFPPGQFLYNILGLPPLSSPKAKQTGTHLVVVSTSPDRPELDLPPVKTLRDEDRKLAPVSSRELQSHRSQAQHPRSRRNIKQEPGLWGQRQPATLYTAKPRHQAGTFQEATHHCPSLQFVSFPWASRETGSLLCSVKWAGPLHNSGLGGGGGSFPWGAQCLHLVLSRPQGRVKSESKGGKGLILKWKDPGATDRRWQKSSLGASLRARSFGRAKPSPSLRSLKNCHKEWCQACFLQTDCLATMHEGSSSCFLLQIIQLIMFWEKGDSPPIVSWETVITYML